MVQLSSNLGIVKGEKRICRILNGVTGRHNLVASIEKKEWYPTCYSCTVHYVCTTITI